MVREIQKVKKKRGGGVFGFGLVWLWDSQRRGRRSSGVLYK
jgi:hypothetical protein